MSRPAPRSRRDFELAIICALSLEADAVIALFDHHWKDDEKNYAKAPDDPNSYTTGVIGKHNVVVAHMPGMGKASAAGVAVGLRMSFPTIRLALVVGICGGVPKGPHGREIYLGDVVISECLVQYDFGRQYPESFEPKDQGGSGVPPVVIQALLRKLETDHHSAQLREDTRRFLEELQEKSTRALYPGAEADQLFQPSYLHQHREPTACSKCPKDGSHACVDALSRACQELGCGGDGLVRRDIPHNDEGACWPSIHIGKMGSGDTVMKSGTHRDEIAKRDAIIAFEMEGAGVYAYFPSLVIKGVCDYADSHKNKQWQNYAAATAAALKPVFIVDIIRDNTLIGQEDVMQFLTEKLSPDGHNRVSLVALGGMGKTRIALEYALQLKDSSVSVFWIHASNKARILDCYAKIAKKVKIGGYSMPGAGSDNPKLVKDWLESDASGRWLIILDNADDHDLLYGPSRLIDILPRSENGSILMTTRDKKVGFDFAGASRLFRLQRLDCDQAQELLRSKVDDEIESNVDSCEKLCEELEGIPLAIVQASAFMHQNSITAEEYLEHYQQSSEGQISLLSEDFEDSVRDKDSRNPIAATWVISFEYIERKIPLAGELLKRMSILDSHAIPASLVQTKETRLDLVKAFGTLQAFCLITPRVFTTKSAKEVGKRYDLHRLVRLAVRNWLRQLNLLDQQTAKILKVVAENHPDVESTGWKEMDRCRAYLPHALAVLSSCDPKVPDDEAVAPIFHKQEMLADHSPHDVLCARCAGDLMMNVSRTLNLNGLLQASVKWATAAIALRGFVYGRQHRLTIEALIQAATVLYDDRQIERARTFGTEAVQMIEAAPEQPPSLFAWSFEIKGFMQIAEGRLPDEYFRKALKIRVAAFDPDHADILRTKIHLSDAYSYQGRYAEYEELMKDLIESYTRITGPTSAIVLLAKLKLAFNYAANGRDREALVLRADVAASECSISDEKLVETGIILLQRCAHQTRMGNYTEALELGRQSLEHAAEINYLQIMSLRLMAQCYEKQRQYGEAEKLRISVVQHSPNPESGESPGAIEYMKELAVHYENRRMYKEATPVRERILEIEIRKLGRRSPKVILDMCELGLDYSAQKLYDKAANCQYSSLDYPLQAPEARLPAYICRMASIARQMNDSDNYDDAEKVARDAVGLARMHEKATQHQTITSLTQLAFTWFRLHRSREAEEVYREAIDIMSSQGEIKDDLLYLRARLASVLLQEGRYKEAEALAVETRETILQQENVDDRTITLNLRTLAAAHAEQGQYCLAERVCSELLELVKENDWIPEELDHTIILDAIECLETLALTYSRAQRHQDAGMICGKTVAIRTQLNATSNMTAEAMILYRDTLNSQARYQEALKLGLECEERYEQIERQNNTFEQMIRARINTGIALSFAGLGKYSDAEPLAREALETCSRIIGRHHPQSLDFLAVLARILREKDNAELVEAKEMEVEILKAWIGLLGEKNLRIAEAMEALAKTCFKLGDMEEAESRRKKAAEIREGVEVGLEGEEKKKLDYLLLQLLERWDITNDQLASAISRLTV
ncbi:hypothetical protein BJY01DRAFT_248323 [Aspergillus pseudoustus]|uniref:Nucleoside phosphorylase domain-containing protein n=1 Tax=Aspergillus pseudoustus TaxID=1810923 RepID=A0ABR4JYS9_9EURO